MIEQIPIKQLQPGTANPRTGSPHEADGFDQLKASIAAHGVLQNLTVKQIGKTYTVVIGNRRLAALKQLVKDKKLAATATVPCIVTDVDDDTILEHAVAENLLRTDMRPLDASEAINRLLAHGHSIKDIANRFGMGETWVRQRQALAQLIDRAKYALRTGEITVGCAAVLTVLAADEQTAVFDQAAAQDRFPSEHEVKRQMQNRRIPASRAIFDLDKYPADSIQRDLFGEDVWLCDWPTFQEYQYAAAEQLADAYCDDGWDWAEVRLQERFAFPGGYARTAPDVRSPESVREDRLRDLSDTAETHATFLHEQFGLAEDDDWVQRWLELARSYQQQAWRVPRTSGSYSAERKAQAGVLICLDPDTYVVDIREGVIANDTAQPANDDDSSPVMPEASDSAKTSPDALAKRQIARLNFHVGMHYVRQLQQDPHAMKALMVYTLSRTAFDTGLRAQTHWPAHEARHTLKEQSYADLYGENADADAYLADRQWWFDTCHKLTLDAILGLSDTTLEQAFTALAAEAIGPEHAGDSSLYVSQVYQTLQQRNGQTLRMFWTPDAGFLAGYTLAQLRQLVTDLVDESAAKAMPDKKKDAVGWVADVFARAKAGDDGPSGVGPNAFRSARATLNSWVPAGMRTLEHSADDAYPEAAE